MPAAQPEPTVAIEVAIDEPPPRLADGIELIGEYEQSGFKEPPSLVRRADGQVIQLPPLLYLAAQLADGTRSVDEIAFDASHAVHLVVSPTQMRYLIDEKLRPLGVVAAVDGATAEVVKADPFLALRFRTAVIPERLSNVLGGVFRVLFLPPVVIGVLVSVVLADRWMFFEHGVAQAIRQSLLHPGLFLAIFAAIVVSAAFHEIGHAAACRYGGARPGKMGCGIYLAWPAFYTDVTDAYRLGRRARLRTDLGGVYFNVIIIVGAVVAYAATGFEPLLLIALVQHFEIVHQLLPIIRLDGYYIVADLTGVPDLFARIGPILRSMVPFRPADERVTVLKRWARVAVTAWVLVVVPLLTFELLLILVHLPRILGTALRSGRLLMHATSSAMHAHNLVGAASGLLQLVVLTIPVLGISVVLLRAARGAGAWTWRQTDGRPVARTGAVAAAACGAVVLASAWVPRDNYHPIERAERGTIGDINAAAPHLDSRSAPLTSLRRGERVAVTRTEVRGTRAEPSESSTTTAPDATTSTTGRATSSSSSSSSSTTSASSSSTSTSTSTSTSSSSTTSTTTTTTAVP